MTRFLAFAAGTLLLAIGITAAIGPVRLLAGLVAVPVMWAILAAVIGAAWLAAKMHGW